MQLNYKLLKVSDGDVPNQDCYLVEHGDMVYFVMVEKGDLPAKRYVVGYPKERGLMAARFRSRWRLPREGEEIPHLAIQRIQQFVLEATM